MNRRLFLTTLACFAPTLLSPGVASAFDLDIGLPGGMTVNTEDIKNSYKGGKKPDPKFNDFTPEQEYYIGRSVSAIILSKYSPLAHDRCKKYLNIMGTLLAQASNQPETFAGYHFMALDTNEINAFSAPGGFIFITKGLLKCCKNEDSIAAVLAHEIGHIQRKHTLQALSKKNIKAGVTSLALPGTSTMSKGTLSDLSKNFDEALTEITTTLFEKGFSEKFEEEADTDAVIILKRVGYDPYAAIDMIETVKKQLKPNTPGFASTHPTPASRIQVVKKAIGTTPRAKRSLPRDFRFKSMTGGI